MNRDTLEKLKEMKLYGMFNTFKASLENYGRNNMTIDKFVNMLVCNEWDERYNRHVNHLIKSAGFRFSASIEDVDYSIERGLDKNLLFWSWRRSIMGMLMNRKSAVMAIGAMINQSKP